MSEKLENVKRLYIEGIKEGKAKEAVYKYTGERYTQHSTGVADGPEGFLDFFLPFLERNPKREIDIIRSIEDGPYVFVHAFQSLNNGEAKWVTMDLFDTNKENKIVEHWDTITAFRANKNKSVGMIDGSQEISDIEKTENNKKRVRMFITDVLQNRNFESINEYIDQENYIEHNQSVEGSLIDYFESKDQSYRYDYTFKVIGQGCFVVAYSKTLDRDGESAVFDVFKLKEGQIVEHWDNSEKISDRSMWNNSGKF